MYLLYIMVNIYIDGVFDLFHRGHLESLKQAKNLYEDVYLIVGVISDSVASGYKREPIISEEDRVEIIKAIKYVDHVITNPPLVITEEFIKKNNIDIVVHGFCDDSDWNKQKTFFDWLIKNNKFQKISYYSKISTTDIINKIKSDY